jgi:hypothetical protein
MHHVTQFLPLLSLLPACTFASQFTPLREPPHPPQPRTASQIELFASGPPARPHADVGLLYVRVLGNWDAQIQGIREAAAEHGCDAAVLSWGVWGATCIMYTAPETERPVVVMAAPSPAPPPQLVLSATPPPFLPPPPPPSSLEAGPRRATAGTPSGW